MAAAPLAKLSRIPASVAAVADYERLARERVTEAAWAYVAGGAADEWTLAENRAAYGRIGLRPRVLRDLRSGGTTLSLFGQVLPHPILLAPVAFQKLVHPEGEAAAALGAAAAEAVMIVSTQASVSLEEVARHAQTAPLWFQLYMQPDRELTWSLVRRAEDAGYRAIVLTVDAPVSGPRNREQRAGFALPPEIEAVNLRGMPPLSATVGGAASDGLLGGPLLAAAPTWRDLAALRRRTRLPVLLKGIMTAEDAARAVEEGVDGIVVSNHGGRALDTVPATIDAMPEIVDAVAGRVPILVDGGIRRGTDVLKALALGAAAVLIGRPYVYGLAAAGAPGVCHVVRILRAELELAMALTGCRTLADISPSLLRRSGD